MRPKNKQHNFEKVEEISLEQFHNQSEDDGFLGHSFKVEIERSDGIFSSSIY